MATLVCDRTPCDYMQAALHSIVTCPSHSNKLALIVSSSASGRNFLVALQYCPFCGTRIDTQWVINYQNANQSYT
jgi:hypothetical protein